MPYDYEYCIASANAYYKSANQFPKSHVGYRCWNLQANLWMAMAMGVY